MFSQPGWTKCELGVKPHVLSWLVTDSSEMSSHSPGQAGITGAALGRRAGIICSGS